MKEPRKFLSNRIGMTAKFRKRRERQRMTTDAQMASAGGVNLTSDINTLETSITQYQLDIEEWKENDKRVRNAKTLLPKWVDPAIRGKLAKAKLYEDAMVRYKEEVESAARRQIKEELRTEVAAAY